MRRFLPPCPSWNWNLPTLNPKEPWTTKLRLETRQPRCKATQSLRWKHRSRSLPRKYPSTKTKSPPGEATALNGGRANRGTKLRPRTGPTTATTKRIISKTLSRSECRSIPSKKTHGPAQPRCQAPTEKLRTKSVLKGMMAKASTSSRCRPTIQEQYRTYVGTSATQPRTRGYISM